MKHTNPMAFTIGLALVAIAAAATPGRAQTTANGPYYATPAWDQTLPIATRFIILSNFASQAVMDRETGLVWERTPSASTFTQNQAMVHCYTLTTGGRMGWRMPQPEELQSLLDPSQLNSGGVPALFVGHPFTGLGGGKYWVKDQAAPPFNNGVNSISVWLSGGTNTGSPDSLLPVWCVRGGHGAPW